MENQKPEAVNEINYLEVTLESSGGWSKQEVKWVQSLVAIEKCLTRIPNMGVKILQKFTR
jgi:hypothetical protein